MTMTATIHEREFNEARALLVLNQFNRICRIAEGICQIVPLKGISLLKTIYSENLDRDAGDIDILVYPANKAPEFIERLIQAGYTRQFDHLADSAALNSKRKIALRGATAVDTDIDIHLDFVTKKFFRHHCGSFNTDALRRCTQAKDAGNAPATCLTMDAVDEWLFLAQHACFHRFSNNKWLTDLNRLLATFTATQLHQLKYRTKTYGFKRVVCTTLNELGMKPPIPLRSGKQFRRLTDAILHSAHSRLADRIFGSLWEILMIDSLRGRIAASCHLALPTAGELKAIYRTASSTRAMLMAVPHFLLSLSALTFFHLYSLRCCLSQHSSGMEHGA